ncbi:MAG: alanyl-tRNA synthetase [Candidatus Uhrbacteria bacterium GW2011_GWD2_52_7]|uniref:Alanine--tRNA ligase n=1 Tax=Candidatus Uhrbacteria bacterium GW2011_GWD2_52_7 TaxID=1618989 RepID=A0A0G1XCB8_9BACT|nr:MAG: alanyl-tRNA synthetase [Candidatus Uhrbacteria bacterium GW2011_GWD2_52_7]
MLNASEIRTKYLEFFKRQGHAVIASASLVPENDPTTLFTGSGMQPMVPYLLGEKHPLGTRITDSQKCFRSQDIEEVGDNRHTTFFEMLGNWSLGDYFKAEQIPWMFEFLTKEIGLDPSRLYVTVFRGNADVPRDEEAIALWQTCFASAGIDAQAIDDAETNGMQGGRIFSYPEKKNWWSRAGVPSNMPVGEPGGPDTEMFWDFGAQMGLHEASQWKDEPCHVNCDCGRFMEIGNNVFMQYVKTEQGFELLPQQNVDFGGGLERMAAASINNPDIFFVSLFDGARAAMEKASGKTYAANADETYAFRVVLDHIRAATFLIGDNVLPSNKDQGYFVRRLIRRAVRFARKLGVANALVREVSAAFIDSYATAYPNLGEKREAILSAIEMEEGKFAKTVEQGLRELKKTLERTGTFTGTDAFNLYQTYGFPLELTTEELQRSHGMTVDEAQFREDFKKHQDLSRAGSEQKFAGGLADHSEDTTKLHTATHLLHQALRMVLGNHVEQRGSNITAERLRFDFSHGEKMTPEQIKQVEDIVNEQIAKDLPVHHELLTVDEAKARGAIGLFEDKYAQIDGGKIKVYFVGDFSKEICGGPHVEHTGQLGGINIQKEEASSAGIRRIKAVLGKNE